MIRLPSTRTFAFLALGSFLVFPTGSIVFGDGSVDDLPNYARIPILIAVGIAFLVMAYSIGTLMVRIFFQRARQRVAPHNARFAGWLNDARSSERVILILWSVWTAGLFIAGIAVFLGAIPT